MNLPIEILFISASIGALTSYLAKNRGRDPFGWFLIGMGFGVFGLISLYFFKDLSESEEEPQPEAPLPQYEWYYLNEKRETIGPITTEEVIKLNEKTLVWNETLTEWQPLKSLKTQITTSNS